MALPTTPEFTSTGTQSVVYAPTADGAVKITSGGGNSALSTLQQQIAQASGAPGSNLNYTANGSPQQSSKSGATSSPGASFGDQLAQGLGTVLGAIGAVTGAVAAVRTIGAGIQATIGSIKAAAGQVGDSVSKARAANLPAGGEAAGGPTQINILESDDKDWRVRVTADFENLDVFSQAPGMWYPLQETGGVVFPYTPTVAITYKANYTTVDPIHSVSSFQGFKNSTVEDITITGDFSVQNLKEADYWLAANQFFKVATKMFYGNSTPQGNPPIICQLSGFGNMILNNTPVVVKSFHVELPADVNYIQTYFNGKNQWVPSSSTFNITVSPIYNREYLRTSFKLSDYADGSLLGIQ